MFCLGIHIFQNVVKFHDAYIKQKNYDFSQLPPHIIVKILAQLRFSDFKNAVLACQSWYHASWDTTITNKLWVSVPGHPIESDILVRPIKNLLIQANNINSLKYRKLLRKYNYSIRQLEVRCSQLQATTVFQLFIYLSNVETFKMVSHSKDFSPGNFNGCNKIKKHRDTIIHNMGKIKSLTIRTRYKNLKPYETLLSYCCNIVMLSWNETEVGGYKHSEFLYNYLLNPGANLSLNNITELLVHGIDRKQNSKFFEAMVQLELRNLKKLSVMEISLTYYDVMFKQFCISYNYLKSLYLNGCNEQQLYDICKYLTRLETLELEATNANNLREIGNLKELQYLKVERVDVVRDDDLIRLFDSRLSHLHKLWLNHISASILEMICKYLTNLDCLQLEFCYTKNCEPIFRNLVKLKNLYITFTEEPKLHSSHFRNSDEWNITKLTALEDLFVSCCVPGITPELVQKLPNLKPECLENLYDPTDEEIRQYDINMENIGQDGEAVEHEFEFSDFHNVFNIMCDN